MTAKTAVTSKRKVMKTKSARMPMGLPYDEESEFNAFKNRQMLSGDNMNKVVAKSNSSLSINRSNTNANRSGSTSKTMMRTKTNNSST